MKRIALAIAMLIVLSGCGGDDERQLPTLASLPESTQPAAGDESSGPPITPGDFEASSAEQTEFPGSASGPPFEQDGAPLPETTPGTMSESTSDPNADGLPFDPSTSGGDGSTPEFLLEFTPVGVPGLVDSPPVSQRTLDVQLEENLTALQTYDALVIALEEHDEQLEELEWITLSGNTTFGWEIDFYNPQDESVTSYVVRIDGSVDVLQMSTASLSEESRIPIERSRVVVDSDEVFDQYDENPDAGPPSAGAVLSLNAEPDGDIVWTVVIGDVITTIDATVEQ